MNTYFEILLGYSRDVFDKLINGYDYYNKNEFIELLKKARSERDFLVEENQRLKTEIATINTNIVANLERDLTYMKQQSDRYIKPKYNITKKIEQLDI